MLKKDEALSEPGSPAHSHQLPSSSAKQIDSKEREELATINKTLADDSFFQISLTNDTLDSSALSGKVVSQYLLLYAQAIYDEGQATSQKLYEFFL